jgi:hypothetical protein
MSYRHGVSIEFVTAKCNRCYRTIAAQPALYAFLYRGTPSAQSSYYHLSCVKKLPVSTTGGGLDRMTGKSLKNKPHYTFCMQNSSPALVKVNAKYIQKLVRLNKTELYKLCLKSPNPGRRNALIASLSDQMARRLNVVEQKAELIKKLRKTQRPASPLKARDVAKEIKVKYDKGEHSFKVSMKFIMRVARRKVEVGIRSWCDHLFFDAPHLYSASWRASAKIEKTLRKTRFVRTLHELLKKKARGFRTHRKAIVLAHNRAIDFELEDTIGSIKRKILQEALTSSGKKGDLTSAAELIALLVDPDPVIRNLAKAQMKRLLKTKPKLKNSQEQTESSTLTSTSSDITTSNPILEQVS